MGIRNLLLTVAVLAIAAPASAQYNEVSCSKRPFTTRLVQVDQLDGSTVFYFEMKNDGQRYLNINEHVVVRDADGKLYKLLNSYNMPLSDEDHSSQLALKPEQTHRYALEFEKLPLDGTFDLVESEDNSRALNFYGVQVDASSTTDKINYDEWVKDYPVMEYGSYYVDGQVMQYISYKGLYVTTHMEKTNEYGKYYTVDVDIQNKTDRDVLLKPESITSTSYIPKKKGDVPMKVLSAEDYDKRVRREQNWTTALVVAAEVLATAAVATAEVKADNRHHHPGPPPRHRGWRPARYHWHPYYPTDYYRERYHSHEMGGLATAATVAGSVALTAGLVDAQQEKRQELQADYIKENTIKPGEEYMGYFHIKYEKSDNLVVSIPLMGETFEFRYQWQDKK